MGLNLIRTSVLIRRRDEDPDAPRENEIKTQTEDSSLQAKERDRRRNNPADALILDF